MRKLTTRVQGHPHNMLKTYMAGKKKDYSCLSKAGLRRVADKASIVETGRAAVIKELLKNDEDRFKQDWSRQFGWDFGDCYDPGLLKMHVENHRNQNPQLYKTQTV
jgi:hypothetical protein